MHACMHACMRTSIHAHVHAATDALELQVEAKLPDDHNKNRNIGVLILLNIVQIQV